MDYLSTIQKYMDGKNYAYKHIKSSDKIGYVTTTGVSKQYASMNDYNATAGKNNCPSNFTQLDSTWSDLGFPVGSLMKSGQSCGNENTYVQASPPQNDFDWEYYIRTYSPEGVTTQQQALNHWNSTGKQDGLLPNATIMTSMSKLGKVGYIDVDTQFHKVPATAKSSYKSYSNISNVTGTTMEDCSRPIPSLKYGDIIVLTNQNNTGYINNSVFKFGNEKTNLYLRPSPGEDQTGKAIKYGDSVCISSSSSSYTTSCGWWGCKVAFINTSTNQIEFGPGGTTTTTFKINPPEGSNYTSGSEIKYGYPFSLKSAESKFAYVSNNVVKFGSWTESINNNVFSVQYTETTPTCDISNMKSLCTDDCVGFIHSPNTNTWQKITPTSTYKITSTVQDIYLKEYDVNLQDSSCTKTDVQFIDPTLFSNYPQGNDFKACEKDQCKVLDPLLLPTDTTTDTTTITNISVDETLQALHEKTNDKMKSKTAEYESVLDKIKQAYLAPTDTLEQQYEDMSIFDKQHKIQLVLWTILTASILAIVLIRK